MKRILVIGANGQIGCELVDALVAQYGVANVIASDISPTSLYGAANYQQIDVLNAERLAQVVQQFEINEVYQLAALLSVTG